jgi:hypothetical protein
MNLALTPAETYRDLVDRAEAYFRRVFIDSPNAPYIPFGVRQWLLDLDHARIRELAEPVTERETTCEDSWDVPL